MNMLCELDTQLCGYPAGASNLVLALMFLAVSIMMVGLGLVMCMEGWK